MNDIILPPSTPRPTEPDRKSKTKAYAKKLLDKILGEWPGYSWVNNRYVRMGNATPVPLKLFLANILSEAKSMGLDPDTVVVRRLAANNSISIEQRIFTETEEQYLIRYAEYECAVKEHDRWNNLSVAEKTRMTAEIKRQRRLKNLQEKKNALKVELNKISDEIDQASGHA